jgi:glutathione synthase/RimK-type ligase-like ATP-grasp enzyme
MRIALATAIAAFALDDDLPPLREAFARAGIEAEVLAWDDPTVSWQRFDAVLLRSTWDYCERLPPFLDWCEQVAEASRLFNPLDLVRWNIDKHYLAALAERGAAIVPSAFIEPGEDPAGFADHDEFVVKPAIGAGSRDARRFQRSERGEAARHAATLLDAGRSVLVQPYLAGVDERGETALIFIDGHYAHAIRKGPLLPRSAPATGQLFATEDIRPRVASEAEFEAAERVLAALPFPRPLYARVDLLPSAQGPLLLELELVEPSLFFQAGKDAADRLVAALLQRVAEG